ncbi:hypothetical protein BHM03_00004293, partial [Ensete ventricosum]
LHVDMSCISDCRGFVSVRRIGDGKGCSSMQHNNGRLCIQETRCFSRTSAKSREKWSINNNQIAALCRMIIPRNSNLEGLISVDVDPVTARKAVDAGVSGIVVSNHGARQLDYTPPTISVLDEVLLSFSSS